MASPDHKVRVFISSTFKDMHAERDHLVTVVFPELRERCERLGLEFFDVDLRWGVPEKGVDGESANSWEYCRKWINEAKPFFVCLLGQRYGWEPEPEQLKDPEDRARQLEQKRSITDMEVHHALENDVHSRRCYFYLRQAQAPAAATEFVDPPPLLVKLDALKARVETCGRPVWHYPCRWTGSGFTDMEAFGKKILENLWSGILRDPRYVSKDVWQQVLGCKPEEDERYTDETKPVPEDIADKLIPLAKPPPKGPLEAEREQMAAFAASRLRWFQGRRKELDQLTAFIRDPAEDNLPRLAVVAAAPGQGKSALMAKLWEELQGRALGPSSAASDDRRVEDNAPYLISHFVGATEQSSTSYNLVKRLLDELDASGIAFPERPAPEGQAKDEPKLDFNSLCQRLSERLGDYAGERRIVILLDALNQLDDGHELGWLPHRLGRSVRIVVSCIDETNPHPGPLPESEGANPSPSPPSGERAGVRGHSDELTPSQKVFAALTSRHPQPLSIPLGGISRDDVRTIVTAYFAEYCKELDPPHVDAICDERKLPQARNPLYLLVMLAELRTLGGNEMNKIVPELIANMAIEHPDTVSLFAWVLQRMEAAEGFGKEAVQAWCLYLALGRVGMASRELADLLARKLGADATATAQRTERALRRYLQRRGETLDFFHGQLRQAVMECYGKEAKETHLGHRESAEYFRSLADPYQDKQWKGEHQRPFNEIAFHLTGAQHWDDLCDYLTDFRCLDVRIRAGQVIAVVTDQRAALAALPELAEEARHERERVGICGRYGEAITAYARDCAAGKHPSLPEPPHTRETIYTKGSSEEHSPRADRLRTIANFIELHAPFLTVFSGDFLVLAANAADGAPLSDAALAVDAAGHPWLHRNPRPPTPPLNQQCLLTLRGHWSFVSSVSLSSDGRLAVSGGGDKTLRVWNLASGKCLFILRGHTNTVESVALSPDGRRALSGSGDKTLRLWDLESGQCLQTLQGHTSEVSSVALSPDGRRALSGSWDDTLRLWALTSGQCLAILRGHTSMVRSVALTPDGSLAVSGGWDGTLRVWDLKSRICRHVLQADGTKVESVSITADGRRAVSSGADPTLRVWDVESGQCLRTFLGHTDKIHTVSHTPDGRRAVSGGEDLTLRVWNLESGRCLQALEGHTRRVSSVQFTPDGLYVVSGGDDRTLRVWDRYSGKCLRNLEKDTRGMYRVFSVNITPDGRLAVFGVGGYIRWSWHAWDIESGDFLMSYHGHIANVDSVSVSSNGRRAVSGSEDHTLSVWDVESGTCLQTLRHLGAVSCVSLTPDGRCAISGGAHGTLRVWDLETGKCLHILREKNHHRLSYPPTITTVCFAPDGQRAVSGSDWSTICLWDLGSGLCLRTFEGHSDVITCVSVSPHGDRVVSSSQDGTVRLWDMPSGRCLAVYHAGTAVHSVAVSPIGDHIACGTEDGQMHFLTMRNFP